MLDREATSAQERISTSATRTARSTSTSFSISSWRRSRATRAASSTSGTPSSCGKKSGRSCCPRARELIAQPSRRSVRDRHRHQPLHHRADRARVRHRAPDRHRHRAQVGGEFTGKSAARLLPRRQDSLPSTQWLAARGQTLETSRAGSTAIRSTTCRCSSASASPWRSIPMKPCARMPGAMAGPILSLV